MLRNLFYYYGFNISTSTPLHLRPRHIQGEFAFNVSVLHAKKRSRVTAMAALMLLVPSGDASHHSPLISSPIHHGRPQPRRLCWHQHWPRPPHSLPLLLPQEAAFEPSSTSPAATRSLLLPSTASPLPSPGSPTPSASPRMTSSAAPASMPSASSASLNWGLFLSSLLRKFLILWELVFLRSRFDL